MQEKKFYVAGVQHHELYKVIPSLKEGDELNLIPEPTNKFDPNAVAIKFLINSTGQDVMIGYVPKKFSSDVSAALEVGDAKCIITKLNRDAKPWEQCEVKISEIPEISEDEENDGSYEEPELGDV